MPWFDRLTTSGMVLTLDGMVLTLDGMVLTTNRMVLILGGNIKITLTLTPTLSYQGREGLMRSLVAR